jgi:hypothetical protein
MTELQWHTGMRRLVGNARRMHRRLRAILAKEQLAKMKALQHSPYPQWARWVVIDGPTESGEHHA